MLNTPIAKESRESDEDKAGGGGSTVTDRSQGNEFAPSSGLSLPAKEFGIERRGGSWGARVQQ